MDCDSGIATVISIGKYWLAEEFKVVRNIDKAQVFTSAEEAQQMLDFYIELHPCTLAEPVLLHL